MHLRLLLATTTAALALGAAPALAGSPAPPPNDAFAAAVPVTAPAVVEGSLGGATREAGEPAVPGDLSTGTTIWYRLDVPDGATWLVSTCGGATRTTLVAFTGSGLRALKPGPGPRVGCARGQRALVGAGEHWLAVDGLQYAGDAAGRFTLTVDPVSAPANDAFADAQVLRRPGFTRGTALLATSELGEPGFAGGGDEPGGSVWYRWRAPRTGPVTIRTLDSEFDPMLGVFVGDLGRLRVVRQNDDGDGYDPVVRFVARRGRTYFIAVRDYASTPSGSFWLSLSDGGARGVGLVLRPDPYQTLDGVLLRGLRASLDCEVACPVRLQAVVSRADARRLGLRSPVLARSAGKVRSGRSVPVVLRLARAAHPALRRAGTVTVRLRATLTGTTAPDRTVERLVELE